MLSKCDKALFSMRIVFSIKFPTKPASDKWACKSPLPNTLLHSVTMEFGQHYPIALEAD